jgi:hypothetical protein
MKIETVQKQLDNVQQSCITADEHLVSALEAHQQKRYNGERSNLHRAGVVLERISRACAGLAVKLEKASTAHIAGEPRPQPPRRHVKPRSSKRA